MTDETAIDSNNLSFMNYILLIQKTVSAVSQGLDNGVTFGIPGKATMPVRNELNNYKDEGVWAEL